MSKSWENDIAKQINRETEGRVTARRLGFSGSNAFPCGDIRVCTPTTDHEAELKGPIQGDICEVEEDELRDLQHIQNVGTRSYLVVKFSRREPLIVAYFPTLKSDDVTVEDWKAMGAAEQFAHLIPDCFNPRVRTSKKTDITRLYVDKPTTDEWPSAQAGKSDVDAILDGFGLLS